MRSEMYDPIVGQLRTKNDFAVCVEADGFEACVPRSRRDDSIRFGSGREESWNLSAIGSDAGVTECELNVIGAPRLQSFHICRDSRKIGRASCRERV